MTSRDCQLLVLIGQADPDPDTDSTWKTKWEDLVNKTLETPHIAAMYASIDTESTTGLTDVAILVPVESSTPATPLLSGFIQNVQSALGLKLRCRVYVPLEPSLPTLFEVDRSPHFLVINGMTPAPDFEKTFNDWYKEEHIALLSQVPSWISSTRFKLVPDSDELKIDDAPQYIALHKWGSLSAFETSQYKTATNTVWRTEVMEHIVAKERFVMEWKGTFDSKSSVTET